MPKANHVQMSADGADYLTRLKAECAKAGGQKAWAEKHGVSPQYVGDVLSGRRGPGESILAALGLVKVVTYRAKS